MSSKLYTMNIHSDLHHASTTINRWGWADYLFSIHDYGHFVTAVFRMPAQKVHDIRSENGFQDPDFDAYRGPPDPYLDTSAPQQPVFQVPADTSDEVVAEVQETRDAEAQHVFDAEQEKSVEIEKTEPQSPAPDPTLESPMPPLPVVPEVVAKPKKPTKVKLEKPKEEAPATAPAEAADLTGLPEWAQ